MTYHSDPTRWTQSQGDAPELLRTAFEAGTHEGPSDFQMRALALKLAAVGGGAALAAGASTAQASATAGGGALTTAGGGALTAAASGGALTLTKIAVSIALIGAAATGTVLWQRGNTQPGTQPGIAVPQDTQVFQAAQPEAAAALAPVAAPKLEQAPTPAAPAQVAVVTPEAAPVAQQVVLPEGVAPVVAADKSPAQVAQAPVASAQLAPAQVSSPSSQVARSSAVGHRAEHRAAETARSAARAHGTDAPAVDAPAADVPAADNATISRGTGRRQQVSEIELLRSARSALAARPREAYRLTEEHRSLYPQGVFTQERDALAVEALQRAGDLKLARELAEAFVKRYPSSPHAHRFRETMNLP